MSGDILESSTYLLDFSSLPGAHSHEQEKGVQLGQKRKWEWAGHPGPIALHHPERLCSCPASVPCPWSLSGVARLSWQCHPQGKHCQPRTPATSKTIPSTHHGDYSAEGSKVVICHQSHPAMFPQISQINLSQAAATRGGFPPEQG